MLPKKAIVGIEITIAPVDDIIDAIKIYLKSSKSIDPLIIVTPNPEQVVYAQSHPFFKEILNSADIALPDGGGIVWGFKKLYEQVNIKRITGVDFLKRLTSLMSENYLIAFLGGSGESAQNALKKIKETQNNSNGWADPLVKFEIKNDTLVYDSETMFNIDNIAQKIKVTKTRLVFIGLGAPKQEYLIRELRKRLQEYKVVLMVVGGAFDYLSENKKRAPMFLQNAGFEWLWRLINEPSRLKRQFSLLTFSQLVLRSKPMIQ